MPTVNMSASGGKADIPDLLSNVRFLPKADSADSSLGESLRPSLRPRRSVPDSPTVCFFYHNTTINLGLPRNRVSHG